MIKKNIIFIFKYKNKTMLHLFAVAILGITTITALLTHEKKRFPIVLTGSIITWILIVFQIMSMYF